MILCTRRSQRLLLRLGVPMLSWNQDINYTRSTWVLTKKDTGIWKL